MRNGIDHRLAKLEGNISRSSTVVVLANPGVTDRDIYRLFGASPPAVFRVDRDGIDPPVRGYLSDVTDDELDQRIAEIESLLSGAGDASSPLNAAGFLQ